MAIRRPTLDQLRSVAEDLGMHMGDEELKSYDALMQANYAAYEAVDAMPDYVPVVKYPRTPGYRPEGEENKYNAWYVKTEIKGAPDGKLAGKTIALKDNICLAGVPMMNGASTLEGYTPDTDATIVTRMLDAGGTIIGKVHCEYFCFSGGSHTCAAGPVHNPHKMGYSAGGSSSGRSSCRVWGGPSRACGRSVRDPSTSRWSSGLPSCRTHFTPGSRQPGPPTGRGRPMIVTCTSSPRSGTSCRRTRQTQARSSAR